MKGLGLKEDGSALDVAAGMVGQEIAREVQFLQNILIIQYFPIILGCWCSCRSN